MTCERALQEIVGVRFSPRGPVVWHRAGEVAAGVRSWVVAKREGVETVGQVIVGRGQCLSFPGEMRELPELLREARSDEIPPTGAGAGQALLDSLPLERPRDEFGP